jgi:mannosyltransferase OCH1-like enzyme
LNPLLEYPAFLTDGGRGALSNNILGSTPLHPFWAKVTDSLIPFNYNYLFPYVTISYASGQWFLTDVFEKHFSTLKGKKGAVGREGGVGKGEVVRIMMDTRERIEGEGKWVFFTQERGGSWVNWDNYLFSWVGDYGVWILGVMTVLGGVLWWWKRRGSGYRSVKGDEEAEGKDDA